MRPNTIVTLLLAATCALPAFAQETAKPKKAARTPIYDTEADANELVAAALQKAKRDNKRVMLMYGGNWCGWCFKLDDVFKKERTVARFMRDEYELVHVDIGRGDKHVALAARFGSEHRKHGYPYLTVIDADGQTVAHKDTAELEEGPKHDPAKVLAFLQEHRAPMPSATQVLADAQARAKAENKLMFVHIGAPWCGWCHRLEGWMARPEISSRLEKDFIDVKIDQDRMENGKVVAALLRQGKRGGIPWFVFLNGNLQPLANSDGDKGNVGFPAQPHEIEHFRTILREVKRNMTDADVDFLADSLKKKDGQ